MAVPRTISWSKYKASIMKVKHLYIFLATDHLSAKDLNAVMTLARSFNIL